MGWFKSLISRARKFAAVDWQTKRLVMQAFSILWLMRFSLWIAPFRWVQRLSNWLGRTKHKVERSRYSAGQLTELVARCALYVPRATCLPQALTLSALLRRQGFVPTLQIGVARGSHGEFQAHAWVEVDGGEHSSGPEEIGRFTALPTAFG